MSVAAFKEGLKSINKNEDFDPKTHRFLILETKIDLFKHPMVITVQDTDLLKYIRDADDGEVMIVDIAHMNRYYQGQWKEITCYDE